MADSTANQRRSTKSPASASDSRSTKPSSTGLTQAQHAVFQQLEFCEYARFRHLGTPQTLAGYVDGGSIGRRVGAESEVF